jgi:hypothetical protein
VLVLTTHGRGAVGSLLEKQRKRSFLHGTVANLALNVWFPRMGHLYRGSRRQPNYGNSLTMPSWIMRRVERDQRTTILGYKERAWIQHQDLLILQRNS